MSATMNDVACLFNPPSNTAPGKCDSPLPIPELLFMSDKVFSVNELADIENAITTAMYATANRLYPFPTLYDTSDKSEQNKTGALGSGPTVVLKEGYVGYDFMMAPNPCQQSRLRDFNGRNMRVFIYGNKKLCGYQQSDGTVRGFTPASVFLPVAKFPSATTPYGTTLQIMFLNNWEFDSIKQIPIDFTIQELQGLTDVKLENALTSVTSGTYNLFVKTVCGGINIYTPYKASLISSDTLWVAKNSAGAVIPHAVSTPIAGNDGGLYFTLKLLTSDAAYTGATGNITFSLVDAPTLKAAGALEIDNTKSVDIPKN